MSAPTPGTAWAHLPNAHLIDAVLRDAADPQTAAGMAAAWDAARDAARDAAWNAAWNAAGGAARDAAWVAAYALIAWDHAALLVTAAEPTRAALAALDPDMEHALTLLRPWLTVWGERR